MKNKKIAILLSAALSSMPVQASVLYGQDFTSVGISSFVFESPYVGEDVVNTWSPYIALQYKNFFIRDVEVGYQFLNTFQYGAAVSLSGDEMNRQGKREGSNKKINDGLNLKGSFSLYRQSGIYTFTAMKDISEEHDGLESKISWLYSIKQSKLTWYPTIYASRMSSELVEHYFDVKDKTAWRYGAGVSLDYNYAPRWSLQTILANESYSKQVTASPSTDRSNVWAASINLGYFF